MTQEDEIFESNNHINKASDRYFEAVTLHNPLLVLIISNHLHIENELIECLNEVLPQPDKLFAQYRPTFPQLIALCQAHGVISDGIAASLRKVNTIRNKFSHNLKYKPDEEIVQSLITSIKDAGVFILNTDGFPIEEKIETALISISAATTGQISNYLGSRKHKDTSTQAEHPHQQ